MLESSQNEFLGRGDQVKCIECKKAIVDGFYCVNCRGQLFFDPSTRSRGALADLYTPEIEYLHENGHISILTAAQYIEMLPPRLQANIWPKAATELFSGRYCENGNHQKCDTCGLVGLGDASGPNVLQFYCNRCDDIRGNVHFGKSDITCGEDYEWHWDASLYT